jgi:dTDP-4-amino-4,6-dideoxygalactose transaminase
MRNNFLDVKRKRIEFGEIRLGETAKKHLMDVVENNWPSAGRKVQEFESKWGELFGYKRNIALSSGTDACIQACLALYELGAEPGDDIIVPALSFIATANAVRAAGFNPVFVDIDKRTLNIDPFQIEENITPRTRAIIVVHTMGNPCDMKTICSIASRHNLYLFEDCCEAHGATYEGNLVGTFGHAAMFSFYVAHLVCCGEGGMLSTNYDYIADIVNSTKCHGRSGLYFDHPRFGLNSKMNDLEASIGLEGIENFDSTWYSRRLNLQTLQSRLKDHEDIFWTPKDGCNERTIMCPHGYSIVLKKGELGPLVEVLDAKGVHWKRNFGCIPTQHKAFAHHSQRHGKFPHAEWVGNKGIHVGVHQYLSNSNISYLSDALETGLKNVKRYL